MKYTEKEIQKYGKYAYLCSVIHHKMEPPYSAGDFRTMVDEALEAVGKYDYARDVLNSFIESVRRDAEKGEDITHWEKLLRQYRDEIEKEEKEAKKKINSDAEDEEEKWITVHPNGSGSGVPVLIDENGNPKQKWAKKEGLTFEDAEHKSLSELQQEKKTKGKSKKKVDKTQGKEKPYRGFKASAEEADAFLQSKNLYSIDRFSKCDKSEQRDYLIRKHIIDDRATMSSDDFVNLYRKYAETLAAIESQYGKPERTTNQPQFYSKYGGSAPSYKTGYDSIARQAYDELYKDITTLSEEEFVDSAIEINKFTKSVSEGKGGHHLRDKLIKSMPAYAGDIWRGISFSRSGRYHGKHDAQTEQLHLLLRLKNGFFTNEYEGTVDSASYATPGRANVSWSPQTEAITKVKEFTGISTVSTDFADWDSSIRDSVMIHCVSNRTSSPIGGMSHFGNGENEVLACSDTVQKVLSVELRNEGDAVKLLVTCVEVPRDKNGEVAVIDAEEPLFISNDPRYKTLDDYIQEVSKRFGSNLSTDVSQLGGYMAKVMGNGSSPVKTKTGSNNPPETTVKPGDNGSTEKEFESKINPGYTGHYKSLKQKVQTALGFGVTNKAAVAASGLIELLPEDTAIAVKYGDYDAAIYKNYKGDVIICDRETGLALDDWEDPDTHLKMVLSIMMALKDGGDGIKLVGKGNMLLFEPSY